MKAILANALANSNTQGGDGAAYGGLRKANDKQPSKQRKGEGYSLSLSLFV